VEESDRKAGQKRYDRDHLKEIKMPIRHYKPTSPGRRFGTVSDFSEITTDKPYKPLLKTKKRTGGRNAHGHTTSRFRGGGAKKQYRVIDFKRDKLDVPGKVLTVEYDPNRTCNIALIGYADGDKRYILAPRGIEVGQTIISAEQADPAVGNSMPLKNIPPGISIHNIELTPGKGGQMARSAGAMAVLSAKERKLALITLPSGEVRRVNQECRATIGQVGNVEHAIVKIGKAGRRRHMGRRPHVRGMAMNPVAHPMGGGEGRSGGGRIPVSPWGKPSKGGKTRNKNKLSNKLIVRRRTK